MMIMMMMVVVIMTPLAASWSSPLSCPAVVLRVLHSFVRSLLAYSPQPHTHTPQRLSFEGEEKARQGFGAHFDFVGRAAQWQVAQLRSFLLLLVLLLLPVVVVVVVVVLIRACIPTGKGEMVYGG